MVRKKRVLVTRPEPAASETARLLEAMGLEAAVLPLSATFQLPVERSVLEKQFDLVALTSANALRHAEPELVKKFAGLPLLAVGDRTAEAARRMGFADIRSASGNAADLVELALRNSAKRSIVAYLCGRTRHPEFEQSLGAKRRVVSIETYETRQVEVLPATLESTLGKSPLDFALIYSENAAVALGELVQRNENKDLFETTVFCCISKRSANALAVGPDRVRVASRPEQQALLQVLTLEGL